MPRTSGRRGYINKVSTTAEHTSLTCPTTPEPLQQLADGTVKQVNSFTGTEVWTVPGRADRPLPHALPAPQQLTPDAHTATCDFCSSNYARTTPEKMRLAGGTLSRELLPAEAARTPADFRLIGNLFEIVSLNYWKTNHGYQISERARAHQERYLADPAGHHHIQQLVSTVWQAHHRCAPSDVPDFTDAQLREASEAFFGGCHDVVIARRHYRDGATSSDQLCASGDLTPAEHAAFLSLTVLAQEQLYAENPKAKYVSVFQNWLRPAGASFDHLHKQLVAIDELPSKNQRELQRLADNPELYLQYGARYAHQQHLVLLENEHAIAYASYGHRYPSLEIYSKHADLQPWEMDEHQLRGMSDVLHACHAATGSAIPVNEEWYTRPLGVSAADATIPWHIVLKWRINTLAGFEGATGIYLNTIDPWSLRDKVGPRLHELARGGRIAEGLELS